MGHMVAKQQSEALTRWQSLHCSDGISNKRSDAHSDSDHAPSVRLAGEELTGTRNIIP